ncbi:MAG: hypothetical protein D6800_06900, partial [Candidatus Zixiibacteriota bacterium]
MKRAKRAFLILLTITAVVRAQTVTNINPANMGDPRTIFVNPAFYSGDSLPFVMAGYQNLHSGLSDRLSYTMVGGYFPTERWGAFSVTVPGFQSPHFNQSGLELRYAFPIQKIKSVIGVNAGTMMTFYDASDYRLTDANDPLLYSNQSLNVFNFGFGMTSRPLPYLTLAIAADHLNRPVVSFQGDLRRE